MIETECYTFQRIQPSGEVLCSPLQLVCEMLFARPTRLAGRPVTFNEKLYIAPPDNPGIVTSACYIEKDYSKLWESRDRIRNYPILMGNMMLYHDGSEDEGDGENDFFVLLDPESGEVVKELRDIPLCWRPAINSMQFFGIKERSAETDNESYFYRNILCYKKDFSQLLWQTEEQEDIKFDQLSANDSVLIATDKRSIRAGFDVNTGECLWRVDPYTLGIFKNQDEFWDKGAGGDLLEHGVTKRLRFALGYPIIYGDTVVMSMHGNHMVGVDAKTGEARWINYLEYSNNLYYQAYGDHLYTQGGNYIEIHHLGTGELIERIDIDVDSYKAQTGGSVAIMNNFTVSDTHVFGSQCSGQLFFSVEKASGKVDWAYKSPREVRADDRPYIHNGRIYYRSRGGMYIFEGPEGYLGT